MLERQTFQNKDLVLKVSPNYNPKRFDPNKYEAFLDALCGDREYQKEAIREVTRYFLSGEYKSFKDLAEENYHNNPKRKGDREKGTVLFKKTEPSPFLTCPGGGGLPLNMS